ncbi:MAG: GAF domain-containing protein [Chthoniobacterales bacterium]
MQAELSPNEKRRLEVLQSYAVMDSEPEEAYDELTQMAAQICDTPIALISLVGEDLQWFKSRVNYSPLKTPRAESLCAHAILQDELFIVPDLQEDERFRDHPLTKAQRPMRFYAGVPLVAPEGVSLGTICVMDYEPRTLTPMQQQTLQVLSRMVMVKLDLRRKNYELSKSGAAQLHLSEDRLRIALDAAQLGTWDTAMDTRTTTWDQRARQQFGLQAEMSDPEYTLECIHPDDRKRVQMESQAARESADGIYKTEFRVIWPDGSIHWIACHGRVVFAGEGENRRAVRMTGVNRDITERRRAQIALQTKSELLTAVSESLEVFLALGDWSKALGRLLRCALDQTRSSYGFIAVLTDDRKELRVLAHEGMMNHPEASPAFTQMMEASFNEKGYLAFTKCDNLFGEVIHSGKVLITNEPMASGQPNLLPEGHPPLNTYLGVPILRGAEVVGMIALANRPEGYSTGEQSQMEMLVQQAGVLCDSYRQKERETLLKRDHESLEHQLRHSQKMEAIGQLAGGVAHDFNNLLTVITGHAELSLMQFPISGPQRDSLLQIAMAGERAAQLTRQLLTFSRRQLFQPQPVRINAIIEEIVKMLRRMVGENVTIEMELAPALPNVQADGGMIEQVLMNLVVNARDAMPSGGQIVIKTGTCVIDGAHSQLKIGAKPGRSVWLSVTDTGTGIDPEHLAHIFEPFYTTKEVGSGTGLGLATVYGIVQQHNGWMEVESEVGKGTTFTVLIPATTEAATGQGASNADDLRGGKETILLAEDEEFVRTLAKRVLEDLGYIVLEATTGAEALEVWEQHQSQIGLLLTDMVMPGKLSGRDVAEKIRLTHPQLPVIYSSGYSQELLKSGLELSDGITFLPKPYRPQALIETVREALDFGRKTASS